MKSKLRQPGFFAVFVLVGLAGFAAGGVFGPAVRDSRLSLAGISFPGLTGAVLLICAWLTVSILAAKGGGAGINRQALRLGVRFAASMLPLISYLPYLAHRSGLSGQIAELPPLGSRYSAIILLFWSLMMLAVLLWMALRGKASRTVHLIAGRPAVTLSVMISAWLAIFFLLDVFKDHYMQTTTVNSALFREAMTHVLDSRGFMFSHLEQASGSSIFGVHINLIFLFLSPFFRLFPDYRWLLFISDAALALAAWPLYKLARRHFTPGLSLMFSAMYLLLPIIAAQPGRSDISEIRFMPLFFFTALYMFETRRFLWFLAASALLLSIREDMGIFVAFFGIYALMRRYPLKWILAPLAAGSLWFIASVDYVLPHLSTTGTTVRSTIRYGDLGSTGSGIVKTLLFKPWVAIRVIFSDASHVGATYGLLISFGALIPLLSGTVIFAIPAVAELLFQQRTDLVNFMAVPSAATLMVALIYGLSRLDRLAVRRWSAGKGKFAAAVGAAVFFLGLAPFHTWFNPGMYRPRYNYDAAVAAFNRIPATASVLLPEFMLVYSTPGQTVSGYHQIDYQQDTYGQAWVDEDYVIIDERIPSLMADTRYYQGIQKVAGYLRSSPNYHKVFERDDIALYVRETRNKKAN